LSHRLEIDKTSNVTRMCYYGDVTEDELRAVSSITAALSAAVPAVAAILDVSETTNLDVRTQFVNNLAHLSDALPKGIPTLIVAPRDAVYGMARMFQIINDESGLQVLRTLDEALASLGVRDPVFVPVDLSAT